MPSTPLPMVIEPQQLQAYLRHYTQQQSSSEGGLLIVDLGSDTSYHSGHVPLAVSVTPRELICGVAPAPGKLPDNMQLNWLFSRLGLTPDTQVVVYDDEGGGWAGRFIWTLDIIGHKKYAYLNGGLAAWKQAGYELETNVNHPQPRETNVQIDRGPIAEIEDILPYLDDPDLLIWDARSPLEYSGQKVLAHKGGHIPGAVNCEWTSLMSVDDGLRIRPDAEAYLRQLGITKDKRVITHCQSHHRSGFTYLVGKALGFDIRAYHGSWAEWGNHADTPVES